ncbi:MAG: hypothetical protein ABIW84_04175 [Ilumatobacteraceae bacterium]
MNEAFKQKLRNKIRHNQVRLKHSIQADIELNEQDDRIAEALQNGEILQIEHTIEDLLP